MAGSRFLVMAMPSPMERMALEAALHSSGLKDRLHGTLFDPVNWHQSLSARFVDRADIEPMLRACSSVRARACTLTFNRIRCEGVHWSFRVRGVPPCFAELLGAVNNALAKEGRLCLNGNSPHISISYWAPPMRFTHKIRPIQWTIKEILLVEGHRVGELEEHYRYDVIDRWSLQQQERPRQRNLFD